MPVLIFSTSYLPFIGGAEVAIKEIVDRVTDTEFHLITARQDRSLSKSEKIGNITVYRVGFGFKTLDKLLLPLLGTIKTIRLNKKWSYFTYWVMMVSFAGGAAYLANIFSRKKVPIVLTLQEGDSEKHLRHRWFGLIHLSWKLALKRSTVVTAISNYLAQRTKKLGYKGKVLIIPNGVDLEKFATKSPKLLKSGDEIKLITAGRVVKKNGVGDIIKALKFLPENVILHVLGGGILESGLKKMTKELKLESRVWFFGQYDNNELPEHLDKSDIFVRPSLSEGQGISFIEAMAVGLPVIATPVGGIVDFLKDGKTGYFCQPEDPDSIAQAVMRIINDPNKAKVIENAKQMVQQKYDWNLIADRMQKEVFEKTAKTKPISA